MEKKCIYCNKDKDLSKSDIIPDALSNVKIINPCVCSIQHNQRFSDKFESTIINGLSPITNKLCISSKKKGENRYTPHDITMTINNKKYNIKKFTSLAKFYSSGGISKSVDGKSMIGELSKLEKIPNGEVENLDLHEKDKIISFKISHNIFFSSEMYRLVTKIAFEWYCLENHITHYLRDFDEIIKFIDKGEGINPVKVVSNKDI